jgi:predicted ATPase
MLPSVKGLKTIDPDNTFLDTWTFFAERWQILEEGFKPAGFIPLDKDADPFLITQDASNLPAILHQLSIFHPEQYSAFQNDIAWLLGHVDKIGVENFEGEMRYYIREKVFEREAPTISAGTARIIAMLLPFYALDMRSADLPGLVVIEEPDTAIKPGLLKRFYTEDEDKPRQVIMTTHNPRFLDYFKPEEVRIVERDANGYTTVKKVPDHIQKVWLDEYTLGEVWMTRSLGGLPE